jgi:hypothetical protein
MRTLVVGSEGLLLEPLVRELTAQLLEPRDQKLFVLGHHQYGQAVPLGGDPGAIDFGLSGTDYLDLTKRIGCVVLAEVPDRVSKREPTETGHVRAAREVLEFVRAGGGKPQVIHLSSLLVFGSATPRVNEGELSVGQGFDNALEESLALAEQIVRRLEPIVPLAVLRVAPLVGDARKNVLDRSSPLFEMLELLRVSGLRAGAPWTDRAVHFETYDHAALALARLAATAGTRTAHLVRPVPPTDRELCAWLAEKLALPRLRDEGLGSLIRRPPLLNLRAPERRALSGWGLGFGTTEAEALGLIDSSPWAHVLSQILASELAPSSEGSPAHA